MSGHQTATIADTVYFWFAANDTAGSGGDGATPLFDVREAGAAASAAPLLSGTPALLSNAAYPAGCYEIAVAATTGNGFAADDTFSVFCTLAVDSQNPSGFVGSCTLTPLAKAAGVALSAGAITNASLAGNMEIVFETDFGTNYNVTRNAWATNVQDSVGTGNLTADVIAISGDSTAADNLELQYDTTGLSGDTFPATQSQLDGLANVGSAVHKAAASYVLTTGTQSANTVSSTEALDGTRHEHTDDTGVMELYYQFEIGSGTPSSVSIKGYITGNNDDLDIYGFDWVTSTFKQIGNIQGFNATTNIPHVFDLFVDMVGFGANEGLVRIRLFKGSGLTTALLAIDQIFVAFSQGAEGYDNGAVWADSNRANTNVVVGIDGVARNTVSTVGAINTLLASTNLHRVEVAPGSSFTFAASQTDEIWMGRDWTLAFGGQDITGSFIFGAHVSGTATATGEYELEECDLGAVTMDNGAHFERCGLEGTFTVGQAGTLTFHACFTESVSGVVIDFAGVGATTINLFGFAGDVIPTNMAAGDLLHIVGGGSITTATCTGGTIEHDGFVQYTDAGGNVTEQQSDIKVAVDATLVDTGTTIPASLATVDTNVDNLLLGLIFGDAATGTLAIGSCTSTLTGYTDDQLIGRVIIFLEGPADGEASDITDYADTNGLITFDDLTLAPENGNAFKIV